MIKETEAILETEKKTLEEEKYKTQDETEQFEQLKVTYKVADGKVDGPDDVPILIPEDKEQDESSANVSTVNFDEEILGLKTQIQLSGQEQNISEVQVKQLQLLTLEKSHLEFQMKEKTNKVNSLESDLKVLKHGKATMENQIKANDAKISLLEGENQQLKMKNFNLEDRVKEKDSKVTSLHTENQALQKEKATFEYKLKAKDDKINSLENENASLKREKSTFEQQINTKDTRISSLENETYIYRSSSLQHTQSLKSLKKEKDTIEQDKRQTINEMDRLKMLNMTLEQSLKSKDDTIASLNRENQNLSTTNQGHQQRTTEMTETYKNLLQSKGNEMELLKQNMELLLANEKQRNDALEDENRVLKRESTQHKAGVQNRAPLSDGISPSNVGSSHGNSSYSDTDYDTEFGNTEESDSNNDINYDTPSENEDS